MKYNQKSKLTEVPYNSQTDIQTRLYTKPIVYVIPYFPETRREHLFTQNYPFFDVDWKDPCFRETLLHHIQPKIPIEPLNLDPDYVKIALHIRIGSDFDVETCWKDDPLKFPPIEYYAEQLSSLCNMLGSEQTTYVRIFTDHYQPDLLKEQLIHLVELSNVEFSVDSLREKSVFQDFFEMMEYDYMIRPASNLSIMASNLHDYRICISPTHYIFKNSKVSIDQTKWVFNK